jgi:hypothetical protein
MFDTVNFWIDREKIKYGNIDYVLPYLSEITEQQNERRGYSCMGKAGDYTVAIFENGMSLKGSLAKYILPSNIYTPKRADIQQAIEKLSDHLHIGITAAKVTRLDVSTVIPTLRPPSDYYNSLGSKPYFDRVQATKDTVYYKNHKRELVFYDKTKEAKQKESIIPDTFIGCNLFRYELRFMKRLCTQFKGDVEAIKLYEQDFYYDVIQRWYNEFNTIQKISNMNFMTDSISSKKEAKEAYIAVLVKQNGMSGIEQFISELKARGSFKNRSDYTKLKAELSTLLSIKNGEQNELINEIETYIYNVAKYAR